MDGERVSGQWSSMPVLQWMHVHLNSNRTLAENITVFGRRPDGDTGVLGSLQGILADVVLWRRKLTPAEVKRSAQVQTASSERKVLLHRLQLHIRTVVVVAGDWACGAVTGASAGGR